MNEELAVYQRAVERAKAELARARADTLAAQQSRDQALEAERAECDKRLALESELGSAHEEITRLSEALRQAARMKTIKGARRIVEDTLGKE
jgi:hypothetical protein